MDITPDSLPGTGNSMANESIEFCLPLGSLLLPGDRTKQVNKQNPVGCKWVVGGALVLLAPLSTGAMLVCFDVVP